MCSTNCLYVYLSLEWPAFICLNLTIYKSTNNVQMMIFVDEMLITIFKKTNNQRNNELTSLKDIRIPIDLYAKQKYYDK